MSKASDLAYRHIRDMILDGSLAPGEPLREEPLGTACGLSRTPVREALRRLETEGFVRRTASQRSFVAHWSFDDIEEAFVLRAMLEGHAAARAALRIDSAALTRLAEHNRAIAGDAASATVALVNFIEHNREFHRIILQSAGSARLTALLGAIIEQPIVLRTARRYDQEQVMRSLAEHEELLVAFRRRDPDWAQAVMVAHIRRAFHTYRDAFLNAPRRSLPNRSAEPRVARRGSGVDPSHTTDCIQNKHLGRFA